MYPYPEKTSDWVTAVVKKDEDGKQSVGWGYYARQDLLDDPEYYREVGEIDLDRLLLSAVRKAVNDAWD